MKRIGRQQITLFLALLLAGVLLSTCGPKDTLDGTSWALVAYGPADAPTPAAGGSLTFVDSRISGQVGCNTVSGEYEVDGDRLAFTNDELAFTVMGCPEDTPAGRQERFLRQWLGSGATMAREGDRLTLLFGEGRQVAEYTLEPES